MHIHLDAVGGVAGDMFIAALLDAFPGLAEGLVQAIATTGMTRDAVCRFAEHRDDVLSGKRFIVEQAPGDQDHTQSTYSRIRARLLASRLDAATKQHAVGIFSVLAEAEARVHGIPVDGVTFHEVGAVDSIADIVGAAFLVHATGATTWSVGPLPLGSGRVSTAHGMLPLPAPATALLLEGFVVYDDGLPGERVTPTGAAILRYLRCAKGPDLSSRTMSRSGIGFGAKTFPGLSNVLRVLVLEDIAQAKEPQVCVIEFEIDDQSGEDLALGLDRLRQERSVLDVLQMPAYGKKGRIMMHVQVLAEPAALPTVIDACFRETTTIGLRYQLLRRAVLERKSEEVQIGSRVVGVKIVARTATDASAKTEAADLADVQGGHAARAHLRRAAEEAVLKRAGEAVLKKDESLE